MDDAAQHLAVIHPLPTPFLGEKGRMAATCSRRSQNNWATTRPPARGDPLEREFQVVDIMG